ncbi:MAG: hypothetical protein CMN72_00035 [Sphingomonas sp.]|nr:hypothetical protein [Sphingomonas sp.]
MDDSRIVAESSDIFPWKINAFMHLFSKLHALPNDRVGNGIVPLSSEFLFVSLYKLHEINSIEMMPNRFTVYLAVFFSDIEEPPDDNK